MKAISVHDLQKRIRSVMGDGSEPPSGDYANRQPIAVVVGVEGANWETLAVETNRASGRRSPYDETTRPSSPRRYPQAASCIVTSELTP